MSQYPLTLRLTDSDRAALDRVVSRGGAGATASGVMRRLIHDADSPPDPSPALERYDALCRAQYRELRRRFAEADLIVIANACRSWLITPETIRGGIALEVEDYLALDPDEAAQLPPVDGPALVARLQALTEVEEHALLWALDTAKARADAGEPVPWGTVLGGQLRGPASN